MHDNHTLAFSIRRPWPKRQKTVKPRPDRPRWKLSGAFWTIAGREYYWPHMIDVWHVEPHDRDSRPPCGTHRWRLHFWHYEVKVALLQKVKRFLFERCTECGHRYPWGYGPISHQWDEPGGRWFRVQRRAYHWKCSDLVQLRRTASYDEQIIRTIDPGGRLFDEFHIQYRLDKLREKWAESARDGGESHG